MDGLFSEQAFLKLPLVLEETLILVTLYKLSLTISVNYAFVVG